MGGLIDAEFWGVAGAMFATAAGMGLMAVAIAFIRRAGAVIDIFEFDGGYNALAPQTDR